MVGDLRKLPFRRKRIAIPDHSEQHSNSEDMVEAALVGCDLDEILIIPSLSDKAKCDRFAVTRRAMLGRLLGTVPAHRYDIRHSQSAAA
jgi:short-subunit dehydrogenase